MRAAFTTEFIYDGREGFLERKEKMMEILESGARRKIDRDNGAGNVIGRISGMTKGLDLEESDIKRCIDEQCYELSHVTIVPFKIVWLLEGGDIIIKEVNVFTKDK